jgi:hypothetical protein
VNTVSVTADDSGGVENINKALSTVPVKCGFVLIRFWFEIVVE